MECNEDTHKMSETDLINCTPHDVRIFGENDDFEMVETIVKSGTFARMTQESDEILETRIKVGNRMVSVKRAPVFTEVLGLPDDLAKPIIVSMPVGQYLQQHPEKYKGAVFGPDTGPGGVVRDKGGQILGTRHFILYKEAS